MSSLKVVEGEANFDVSAAGKPCKTWYKVFGDLKSSQRPLVVLHGGPGCAHDYLLTLVDLATSYAIPVVLYDQLGNGKSTHLQEKNGDDTFWTVQLFIDELDNLLAHLGIQDDYDLLGHSWGGMLGASFAILRPDGLKRLIISDSPASMQLWVEAQNKLREKMPQALQDTLNKHEAAGTTTNKDYLAAVDEVYALHVCLLKPFPEDLARGFAWIEQDPTVYHTMNGPSEFYITGSLKDWSVVDEVHKINVPTLLLNGRYDEAQDSVVLPFFQSIPKVKWVTFEKSSHTPHHEERERYMEVVGGFLTSV